MSRVYSVGISPCPNDTFLWGPLALGAIRLPFSLEFHYADIETLNQLASARRVDVLKLSFFRYAQLPRGYYRLLPVGAALGYGVGPLLVARRPLTRSELLQARVGVPGLGTTAYSLLRFYMPDLPLPTEMRYDALLPAVAEGRLDAAVIIHESRFTYASYGLICLQDLGAYWTEQTGYPIPLGGVFVRPHVPRRPLIRALRRSLWAAWDQRISALPAYIAQYAHEMEPSVQAAHIALYVNPFTYRLGKLGWAAVRYYVRCVRHFS